MATTTNHGIEYPLGTDPIDLVEDFKALADSTDAALDNVGGGSSTLDGLTDVNVPSPTNGNALTWNGSEWVDTAVSGSGSPTVYFGATQPDPTSYQFWAVV